MHLCVVHMHTPGSIYGVKELRVHSFHCSFIQLLEFIPSTVDSGSRTLAMSWQQVPLPTEPSHQPQDQNSWKQHYITDIFPLHDRLCPTESFTSMYFWHLQCIYFPYTNTPHFISDCSNIKWQNTQKSESHSTSWYSCAVGFLSTSTQTLEKVFF